MSNPTTWEEFNTPAAYAVFVWIPANPKNGRDKPMIARVGNARTLGGTEKLIREDLASCRETFGGMFSAVGTRGREYKVFKGEWAEIAATSVKS